MAFGKYILYISVMALALFFGSCDDTLYFNSPSHIQSELQGTWEREQLIANPTTVEHWTFDKGSFTYQADITNPAAQVVTGTYTVLANWDRVKVIIYGVGSEPVPNGEWQVININSSILTMVTQSSSISNALTQREFIKK